MKHPGPIAAPDRLGAYYREISRFPLLSHDEERELARKYRDTGDRDAAYRLVTSNLRFVLKIAHEYSRYGMNIIDLIQEGNIGLMKAVQKFDPDRGFRLISYAVWWIRAYIQAYILRNWSLVKIGTRSEERQLFFALEKAKKELVAFEGARSLPPPPGVGVIEQPAFSAEEIEDMDRRIHVRDVSMDAPLNTETTDTFADFMADPKSDFQADIIKKDDAERLQAGITEALKSLDERERYIVENRVMAESPMTLEDIGKTFGVTKERARQLESRALKRLKDLLKGFKPE
jgi:RNA polymerase sigma-32 factor